METKMKIQETKMNIQETEMNTQGMQMKIQQSRLEIDIKTWDRLMPKVNKSGKQQRRYLNTNTKDLHPPSHESVEPIHSNQTGCSQSVCIQWPWKLQGCFATLIL